MHKWFVYDDFDAASKATADFLAQSIESCLNEKIYVMSFYLAEIRRPNA